MASLGQVTQTIAQNLVTPIYPNGVDNPSIVGVQVTINDGLKNIQHMIRLIHQYTQKENQSEP